MACIVNGFIPRDILNYNTAWMKSIYAQDQALQQPEDWWLASGQFYTMFACLAEFRAAANFFANSNNVSTVVHTDSGRCYVITDWTDCRWVGVSPLTPLLNFGLVFRSIVLTSLNNLGITAHYLRCVCTSWLHCSPNDLICPSTDSRSWIVNSNGEESLKFS